jgi:DNA (cytosine-5)-methyltransferase 1|tara:strand:- start:77 stop:742 length:666 start_codon:yes stop_codon:yes gene_type:complete
MEKIKILNLYACLGGNRYKWDEVANIEVTAVELDPVLAKLYQERFPRDEVIIGDAHSFLLKNFKDYDFIWSSPPCPKHSRARYWSAKGGGTSIEYVDMKLYQEIILLDKYFKGKYVIENVIPYYEPLIPAQKRGRHLYWANFKLPRNVNERKIQIGAGINEVKKLCEFHEFDFYKYKGSQRTDKIARNLVDYQVGKTIFEMVDKLINNKPLEQIGLFGQVG